MTLFLLLITCAKLGQVLFVLFSYFISTLFCSDTKILLIIWRSFKIRHSIISCFGSNLCFQAAFKIYLLVAPKYFGAITLLYSLFIDDYCENFMVIKNYVKAWTRILRWLRIIYKLGSKNYNKFSHDGCYTCTWPSYFW